MDLGQLLFYAAAAATLIASLGVVLTRHVVYSALLLILALSLTGLIYLLLLADFLALVQILIYGGTVSVLLVFALMLTRPQERPVLTHRGWPLAALGAVVLFAILLYQSLATPWLASVSDARAAISAAPAAVATATPLSRVTGGTPVARPGEPFRAGPADIGTALFSTWAVPFEIASLVLLVALMGALVIARAAGEPVAEAGRPAS